MTDDKKIARIRWKCRRGTLELDLLLQRFLADRFESLTHAEKTTFEAMLDEADPVLQSWLMKQAIPESSDFQHMVDLIRRAK